VGAGVPPSDVESERKVSSKRSGCATTLPTIWRTSCSRAPLPEHPLGRGAREHRLIEAMDRDEIAAYTPHYRPSNMVFVVAAT
jgi:hypothetical protein